eukprot:CAMPEP_0115716692 /NCGR_PEP_ID=MMETSP0272-20121206/76461_1 /TAXON_ID=71861 /ORGANISM="Scrippsiella trochoidea, Strain CCMP3099" /LENGTH=56 /DNA_ID=CAMNT_0003159027 /DNA_START=98 /DNA_END=268 /DNA_ORIENTATION=-
MASPASMASSAGSTSATESQDRSEEASWRTSCACEGSDVRPETTTADETKATTRST